MRGSRWNYDVQLIQARTGQSGESNRRQVGPDRTNRERREPSGLRGRSRGERRGRQSEADRVNHHLLTRLSGRGRPRIEAGGTKQSAVRMRCRDVITGKQKEGRSARLQIGKAARE